LKINKKQILPAAEKNKIIYRRFCFDYERIIWHGTSIFESVIFVGIGVWKKYHLHNLQLKYSA